MGQPEGHGCQGGEVFLHDDWRSVPEGSPVGVRACRTFDRLADLSVSCGAFSPFRTALSKGSDGVPGRGGELSDLYLVDVVCNEDVAHFY